MDPKTKKLTTIWKFFSLAKTGLGFADHQNAFYRAYKRYVIPVFMVFHLLDSILFCWTVASNDDLGVRFQQGMYFACFVPFFLLVPLTYASFDKIEKTLLWAESLHCKFPTQPQCFERAKKRSTLVFKYFFYGNFGGCLVVLVLQVVGISWRTGHLESNFSTPPPFGTNLERVLIFLIQYLTCSFMMLVDCLVFSMAFTLFLHLIAALEYLEGAAKELTVVPPKSIVDFHCEIMKIQDMTMDFFSYYFGMFEVCTYFGLLTLWFLAFFMPGLIIFALEDVMNSSVPYLFMCILNEKLSDSYEDFKTALYDLQWFEMPLERRKDLILIMVMVDQKKLLRCGPLHVLSFEEVSVMLNRVYSYGLAINKFMAA